MSYFSFLLDIMKAFGFSEKVCGLIQRYIFCSLSISVGCYYQVLLNQLVVLDMVICCPQYCWLLLRNICIEDWIFFSCTFLNCSTKWNLDFQLHTWYMQIISLYSQMAPCLLEKIRNFLYHYEEASRQLINNKNRHHHFNKFFEDKKRRINRMYGFSEGNLSISQPSQHQTPIFFVWNSQGEFLWNLGIAFMATCVDFLFLRFS